MICMDNFLDSNTYQLPMEYRVPSVQLVIIYYTNIRWVIRKYSDKYLGALHHFKIAFEILYTMYLLAVSADCHEIGARSVIPNAGHLFKTLFAKFCRCTTCRSGNIVPFRATGRGSTLATNGSKRRTVPPDAATENPACAHPQTTPILGLQYYCTGQASATVQYRASSCFSHAAQVTPHGLKPQGLTARKVRRRCNLEAPALHSASLKVKLSPGKRGATLTAAGYAFPCVLSGWRPLVSTAGRRRGSGGRQCTWTARGR